jgi:serine/threonine protein kinase
MQKEFISTSIPSQQEIAEMGDETRITPWTKGLSPANKVNTQIMSTNADPLVENRIAGYGEWRRIRLLGKGSFCKCFLVQNIITGRLAVAKVAQLDGKRGSDRTRHYVEKEIAALITLASHPNICQLLQVIHQHKSIILILEYVEGIELYDLLKNQPGNWCSEELVRDIACQLLSALDFMHSRGVLWRDLKYENIMITKEGVVKVIDFNLASHFQMGQVLQDPCGTIQFCSPYILYAGVESVAKKRYLAHPGLDLWSFAICLYGLSTGHFPFYGTEAAPLLAEMRELAEGKRVLHFPNHMSDEIKHLLSMLLNPHFQWQAHTVMEHVWFRKPVSNGSNLCNVRVSLGKRMERQESANTLVDSVELNAFSV